MNFLTQRTPRTAEGAENSPRFVIPAKAGIQRQSLVRGDMSLVRAGARSLDSRLRGNDGSEVTSACYALKIPLKILIHTKS